MRTGLVVGVAVLAWSVSLFAGQSNLSRGLALKSEKPVTIKFQGAQLTDILQFLGGAVGVEIRMSPGTIVPRTPITVNFTNAKFEDVFHFLINAAKLNYIVTDEKTIVVSDRVP